MTGTPVDNEAAPERGGFWNLWLGVGTLVFALVSVTLWFPQDIGSGFLKKSLTGQTVPGDAFFPVLLMALMVPLAVMLVFTHFRSRSGSSGEPVGDIGLGNLAFLLRAMLLVGLALLAMNWTGPALVWCTNAAGLTELSGYRAVSGTFPFDVSGFFVGGTLLTCGFIHTTRHTLRLRDVVIAAVSTAALILVFDVLLINVQLPPNADF
ncbi:hypothetical protein J0X15_10910 [Roseibium sp. CAU 1637]|uniref:Uncharacterized protein n=1 Tax=Roseibium limicola TaxID=2816037 RepID=A0A939J9B7_9HYPH|nr:tripartite tricarboxylate transporter TctB family protein [Roseibium limicola]MBO0345729.1 hypothetical protein [Roseibium limicola]